MDRYRIALTVFLLAVIAAGCEDSAGKNVMPGSSDRAGGYPSSMAALGDSITVGYGSCPVPGPCQRHSFATGDSTQVDSHYERIVRVNPAMKGHAHNYAAARATVADLPGQAEAAANAGAEYITILIGANDACRPRIEEMTSPEQFRASLDSALDLLHRRLPKARVLVLSIPDVYRVWQVGHTNRAAVAVWGLGICPSLLANPTSNAKADTARREAFADRIGAYNDELKAACTTRGSWCHHDRGAVHRNRFALNLLSPQDFFHPNASGQRMLARVSYPARFGW